MSDCLDVFIDGSHVLTVSQSLFTFCINFCFERSDTNLLSIMLSKYLLGNCIKS